MVTSKFQFVHLKVHNTDDQVYQRFLPFLSRDLRLRDERLLKLWGASVAVVVVAAAVVVIKELFMSEQAPVCAEEGKHGFEVRGTF